MIETPVVTQLQDFHTVGDFRFWLFSDGLVEVSIYGSNHYGGGLDAEIDVCEAAQTRGWRLEGASTATTLTANPDYATASEVAWPLLKAAQAMATALSGDDTQRAALDPAEHRDLKIGATAVQLERTVDKVKASWRNYTSKQCLSVPYAAGWLEAITAAVKKSQEPIKPLRPAPKKKALSDAELDALDAEALARLQLVSELRKARRG